jgi:hypothetical protein
VQALQVSRKELASVSTKRRSQMTLQEATMPYVSCPTAVIDTRVDVAWALLMNPAAWGGVFDMRVGSIDPPGPAVVEQKISGETGPRLLHLKLTFRMIEIDPYQHRLCRRARCGPRQR